MSKITIKGRTLAIAVLSALALPAQSHEFWIEPIKPSAPMSEKIAAHGRVGQGFKGEGHYYIPQDIKKLTATDSNGTRDLKRTIGDFPIFEHLAKQPGLQILSYVSTSTKLTYHKPGKFEKFLTNQGLLPVLQQHKKRGLPDTGFSEIFIRHAKALVNRGTPSGNDKKLGLLIELVAQQNPYKLQNTSVLPVKLFWKGAPLSNAQITIFQQTTDDAIIRKIRTNQNGEANIPTKPGKTYMLNAVKMTPKDAANNIKWASHWASLTFTVQVSP